MDRDTELHPTNTIDAERIRGISKDSSGKLWSIYLAEADEYDEEIAELWRGEADSILVFTGLFSGVIATFLSISYYDLFPNSTDTTNALLAQISLQLVNISNDVPSLNDVTIGTGFTPSAATIRVSDLPARLGLIAVALAQLSMAQAFQKSSQGRPPGFQRLRLASALEPGLHRFRYYIREISKQIARDSSREHV
ncbi:hypothetical protein EDB85DRAFT_2126919 [Lactarius pseudohatsudake]|nr:hypothetical protein EDB85DRAFT_2126919 [Lactarius pseudohatsudake]